MNKLPDCCTWMPYRNKVATDVKRTAQPSLGINSTKSSLFTKQEILDLENYYQQCKNGWLTLKTLKTHCLYLSSKQYQTRFHIKLVLLSNMACGHD